MPGHDIAAALAFLTWLTPTGPWVLVAIEQEKVSIETRTFHRLTSVEAWLSEHPFDNVYYHVNETLGDISKKADRADMARVRFLHVDVDPRAGEDLQQEQERIRLLWEKLPPGLPQPSAIVFSGGGYNALWRLQEPIEIGGDVAKAEEAKRYNLQLEVLLGGDNCHDITRILRLPGTVNWPDERKRKRGRAPVMATCVAALPLTYPLHAFVAAPLKQAVGMAPGGGIQVNISGNVRRLSHVNELGEAVSNRTKMLIVQGTDPDDPVKWSSRSELLFHVCCELVRAHIDNETIYSVITDPGFLVSASVLDKGSSAHRYATRQIQRANENAIDPQLTQLNDRYAVIGNAGGKCRVVEEVMEEALGRPRLTYQSFDDFRGRYMHKRVEVGKDKNDNPVYKPLGKWWLENENRRQYDRITFSPGKDVPEAYNLWRGFAYEARPGTKHQLFLDHVLKIVCGGVQQYFDYLMKWMARAVQTPDSQGEVAVVLRGDMGTGKGTVAREFGALWGRHYIQVSNAKHLVGDFNSHLRDTVVVFADEAFYAGDKRHESVLKTMITEDTLIIEGKGRDAETCPNYVHLLLASNSDWVVPAGPNERRYLVLDVLPARMQDTVYFALMRKEMQEGGRENLLHYLLTMDLTGWDVRKVPRTKGLQEQKLLSLSSEEEWWYRKLESGEALPDHVGWNAPVWTDALVDDYLEYAQRLGVKRCTATALGKFLHRVLPAGWPRVKQLPRQSNDPGNGARTVRRCYAWLLPSLEDCRASWDARYGGEPYPWPAAEEGPPGQVEQVF